MEMKEQTNHKSMNCRVEQNKKKDWWTHISDSDIHRRHCTSMMIYNSSISLSCSYGIVLNLDISPCAKVISPSQIRKEGGKAKLTSLQQTTLLSLRQDDCSIHHFVKLAQIEQPSIKCQSFLPQSTTIIFTNLA